MAKPCIICGSTAGSHEHVFPAALGGRRTSKQIYCAVHNQGFGRHVAILEEQLSILNAPLEIRHDRRESAKPFVFSNVEGESYSILGETFEVSMPPDVGNLERDQDGKTVIKVSNMARFEEWREKQCKAGWEVKVVGKGEVTQKYFVSQQKITHTFGGKPFLQAVAYLGLTFFAQYFPEHARQDGLTPLKQFLDANFNDLAEESSPWVPNVVWWDGREIEANVGSNPYAFGHTIVVGVSSQTQRAYAYVSFFSSLSFGIDLGAVAAPSDRAIRVFIDPKSEKAGSDDLRFERFDAFDVDMSPRDADLAGMIQSGTATEAMNRFGEKVSEYQFQKFTYVIGKRVSAWTAEGVSNRNAFAVELVNEHAQRVLNLLDRSSKGLHDHFRKQSVRSPAIHAALTGLVKADDSQPGGISALTSALLLQAKTAIAKAIEHELAGPAPDGEQIALLLYGGRGIAVVTTEVLLPRLLEANSKR
ncbi:HNH endonuclease [Achromobacter kerstersii]|uniref:HNH endonuclease n=1 Tax=Achromobacter kerstersii TaxID=1353890 RepID=UPI0006C0A600|nr:HNH endonuclease [Achromobacter kerstersii]CUJ49214.1 Uncharacterised protein [Achromobacter kerstersii]